MKLSARNQFKGVIEEIEMGAVNGIVKLSVGKEKVSATISKSSIEELELKAGKAATAVVKATEVLVATGEINISARNQWKGKVLSVEEGVVSGIVHIEISEEMTASATISMAAIKELDLKPGKEATAVVKATSVMIMA